MTRDEMIEVMARGVLVQHWLDAGCGQRQAIAKAATQEFLDGDVLIGDGWTNELRRQSAALSALETAGGAVVPAALLKEYRPTMAEDTMRHWAAELSASQQEKTDAG